MKLPFEKHKRKLLVKKEAKASEEYGINPEERSVEELINYGVITLNKPRGPTSHQTADFVKKILSLDKAGHGGSLDPKVIGVLPISLGRATRISQTLLKAGKEYVAIMQLHEEVEEDKLKVVFKKFTGKIRQMPPVRSAVKRRLRTREIYYLEILEIKRKYILFKVGCQAGTYIRKLIHDMGKELGVGAHMKELIRTKAGPFKDKEMYTLHDLQDAYSFFKEDNNEKLIREIIKPVEFAIEHLPKVYVFNTAVDNICHGSNLYGVGVSKLDSGIEKGNLVAVMTLKNELICLGNSNFTSEEILTKEKESVVKTKKVFMLIGIYK